MNRKEALIRVMELEMARTHRKHLGNLQARAASQMVSERMKRSPNQAAVKALRKELLDLEREKDDTTFSLTMRDLIEPLRSASKQK
ncbi:hypothetical protein LAG73_10485 [Pseudoxanthomonas japonensis]|jgi:hypothetical protein|nr:hypothetical protein LAG73_10485 [Pseudoxanthomonas japonensis]